MKRYNDYSGLISEFIILNKAKIIVEIGVNAGQTTIALCEAAKNNDGHVYGIDLWNTHGLYNQFQKTGDKNYVESMLKSNGYTNFTLIQKNTFDSDFSEQLKKLTPEIDLAFIDACHSYKGCLNDFQAIYPLLSKIGIVVFHDTQRIDGCREFMYDLRTKFYDGTYDIFDLGGGYQNRMMGISFLIKRQFPVLNIPINQCCGSVKNPYAIELQEKEWYENELNKSKINVLDVKIESLEMCPIKQFRPDRNYLDK